MKKLWYLYTVFLPAIRVQWPAAKGALKEFAKTNPNVAALVQSVEDAYHVVAG